MPEIIEEEYQAGVASFNDGGTARNVVQRIAAADRSNKKDADARAISFALGYIDGALNRLRAL